MSKLAKILVTAGVICLFIILFAAVVGMREAGGSKTPGIFGLILFTGTIGAVRSIWKSDKKNDNNNNSNNSSILQK